MYNRRGLAALVGALILVCGVVAWAVYARTQHGPAPQPVSQVTAQPPGPTAVPTQSVSPSSTPSASPAATPSPSPTPAPVIYVPEAPTAGPNASPTPYGTSDNGVIHSEVTVAATLAPHLVAVRPIIAPPNAPPRILSMELSTPVAHGGDVVSGYVRTSSNVASVEARIAGYSSSMRKIGVGKFVMSYRVPRLPFFLHRTYDIVVIARNTRGDSVRSSLPITIR